jgi:poly(hydroxyalkanoate) granule-associated protein
MATRPHPPAAADTTTPASESSHHIWLAGLGALARAQAEGGRAFEALVKQGLEMQNKTQTLAKERMAEAAEQMQAMTRQATAPAWDRLGGIFEKRVAQALTGLGMPTAQELAALTARVEALEHALGQPPAAAAPAHKPRAGRKMAT